MNLHGRNICSDHLPVFNWFVHLVSHPTTCLVVDHWGGCHPLTYASQSVPLAVTRWV